MKLFLGDSFDLFKEFDISVDDVKLTYSNPDHLESLSNNVRLYLKSFSNSDDKRTLLLVGTQIRDDTEIFAFSYWVPKEYKELRSNLIDILDLFANQFGLRIKIGSSEGFLLRHSEKFISGNIEDPNSLVKILAPDQIPCQYFLFTSQNLIGNLNRVSVYYAFALNTGKYTFWVNSTPTVTMEVKSGWYEFVKNNFVEFVQPHGKTKIRIEKQKNTDNLEPDRSESMVSIEIPAIYKNPFKHILTQINKLKNDEKIIFKISFDSPRCLFCQSDNISKEHIFPIWIRPFLKETTFDGLRFSNFGDETLKRVLASSTTDGKKESSHGYTTKLVCEDCNNTWLSQLENKVKNILVNENQLIHSIPEDIPVKDAKFLSLWLITKALLLSNKMYSNIHLIKKQIFEDLKGKKINAGFLVEATTAVKPRFNFIIGKGLLNDGRIKLKKIAKEPGKQMAANLLTCSIQLNHLLFRVSYILTDIPLVRETSLKETQILFPYRAVIQHRLIKNRDKLWQKTIDDDLELHLFAHTLLLVEPGYFEE